MLIALALMATAALPRFYELGALGFYGDEETTAFPARALAEGGAVQMPSGMQYYRALPFTWLNAISARYLGVEREIAYRFPAAVLGTLTIPLFFLVANSFVGWRIALIASLLLAFSEWHIATSREARMYAPFLFFFIAAAFATWRWAQTGQVWALLSAAVLFAASVAFHELGILGAMFAVIPLAYPLWARVPVRQLLGAMLVALLAAHAYSQYFVLAAFKVWPLTQTVVSAAPAPEGFISFPLTGPYGMPISILLMLIGAALGLWTALRVEPKDDAAGAYLRSAGRYGSAICCGALGCIGQLYGALLAALVFLYLHLEPRNVLTRRIYVPVGIATVIAAMSSGTIIAQSGLVAGIKELVRFPFPYVALLVEVFPIVVLLFAGTAVYLLWCVSPTESRALRASVLVVVLTLIVVGALSQWGGIRYLITMYPFMLLVIAGGVVAIVDAVGKVTKAWSGQGRVVVAIAIVMSGALTGHGIPQAVKVAGVKAGDSVDKWIFAYPFYPDHQKPGQFVKARIAAGDIVIAEDPLQQKWYVGKVDYWFRNPAAVQKFVYRAHDGKLRDIYVGSVVLEEKMALETLVAQARGRVWFITSGETYPKRQQYLSTWQHDWLQRTEVEYSPEFIGRDQVTKVFCLNCTNRQT